MKHVHIQATLLAIAVTGAIANARAQDTAPTATDATSTTAEQSQPQADAQADRQAPPAAPATTKTSPAPAPTPQDKVTELDQVTVTALRQSLQSAQTIKQDADMIVDSIVAEDIGKLPDNSVADALQRITGVQIAQGFKGETEGVVVRGLPNVVTTLNGREIFSGAGRSFAFQNLPATAVRTLRVYKSSEASLPDGGIAGLVDMQLYRPFDFEGFEVATTLTGVHSKYGGKTDPTASALFSNRWNGDHGEFGALINFGYLTKHYDYNAVWGDNPVMQTDGVDSKGFPKAVRGADGNLVAFPNAFGAAPNFGKRKREQINYALQWKPNDSTEVYLEGLYANDRDDNATAFYFSQLGGGFRPTQLTMTDNCYANQMPDPPPRPDPDDPTKLVYPDELYFGQTICDAASGTWTGNNYAATSTQAHEQHGQDAQHSIGVKWDGERLHLSSDLSYTVSDFKDKTFIIDTFLKGPLTTVWEGTAGDHQTWYLAGNPQLDPANFYLNGLFQTWGTQRGKETAWRGDGHFDFDSGALQSVQFGLRYADHKATSFGSVNVSTPPPGGAGTGNIVETPNSDNQAIARFPNNFFCIRPAKPALPQQWLTPCFNYLVDHADDIRALYGLPAGLAPEDPGRFFDIQEKRLAGYVQLKYDTELFGLPIDGLAGVRAEQVKRNLDAFLFRTDPDTQTSSYTPISRSTSDMLYLPNASANLHLTEALQLRVVAAKTITYPGFGSLNPSLSLNPGTINRRGVASSGNPDLVPIESKSYDASLEWYFSDVGSASLGVFYRDIDGYIQNFTSDVVIDGGDYQLTSPQSAGSGHLAGAEAAYQQFFDFLPGPWSGLGVQLNYTYIDGTTRSPQTIGGPVLSSPLQNVSKNSYNAVLIYEKYDVSARLAYNYRSRYIDFFTQPTVAGVYDEIEPASSLDFSLGYDLNPRATVVFSATNLLGNNLHQYWGDGNTRPRDIRYQDRTIGLGFRFKL